MKFALIALLSLSSAVWSACLPQRHILKFDTPPLPSNSNQAPADILTGGLHASNFLIYNMPLQSRHNTSYQVVPASGRQYIVGSSEINGLTTPPSLSIFLPNTARQTLSFTLHRFDLSCSFIMPAPAYMQKRADCVVHVEGFRWDENRPRTFTSVGSREYEYAPVRRYGAVKQMGSGDMGELLRDVQLVQFTVELAQGAENNLGLPLELQVDNLDFEAVALRCQKNDVVVVAG